MCSNVHTTSYSRHLKGIYVKEMTRNELDAHHVAYLEVLRQMSPKELTASDRELLAQEDQRELQRTRRARRELLKQERDRTKRSADLPVLPVLADPQECRPHVVAQVAANLQSEQMMRIAQLERRVQDLHGESRAWTTELTATQARARQLDTDIVQARAQLVRLQEQTSDHLPVFESELNRLRQLPGVTAVKFDSRERSFAVSVSPRVIHEGTTYDFGDWTVTVSSKGQLTTQCVRRGLIKTGEPATLRGSFCLGARSDAVGRMLNRFEILEAVTLVIEALHALYRYHSMVYPIGEYFAVTTDPPTMQAV